MPLIMEISSHLSASILMLASFLLAFTPPLTRQDEMVSFDRGGFNLVQQDTSNGYVIQGFPLTDNWKNPTVVQVLQAGVDVGSTYDMEVADFKSEANAADSEINVVNLPTP